MTKADRKGQNWTFPESAEIVETSPDQILATKVKVEYLGSIRICCHIVSKDLIKDINASIESRNFNSI